MLLSHPKSTGRASLPWPSPRWLWSEVWLLSQGGHSVPALPIRAQLCYEVSIHTWEQIFPDSDTWILRTSQFMHVRISNCTQSTGFAQDLKYNCFLFSRTKIWSNKQKKPTPTAYLWFPLLFLYCYGCYSESCKLIRFSLQFIICLLNLQSLSALPFGFYLS